MVLNTNILSRFLTGLLVVASFCILITGCGKQQKEYEITETRVLPAGESAIRTDLTSSDRFGNMVGASQSSMKSAPGSVIPLEWDLPEGWNELAPTNMRMVNLQVAGDPDSECYVTILSGGGGGLEANINRWRKQMSLRPLLSEEISQLQKKQLFGHAATYLECEGEFSGMGSEEGKSNYTLSGVILEHRGISMFVKMTGPTKIVDTEIQHFDEFCRSLRLKSAGAPRAEMRAHDSEPGLDTGEFVWHAPEHWQKGDDRSMRLVTYYTGADAATECYVTLLPGTAGGVTANINRWRRQAGQSPLTTEEIDGLPLIEILKVPTKLVEITGDYTGMSGETRANYTVLGAVCALPDSTLFVKMTGPHAEIQREREQFIKFCRSIDRKRSKL